MSNLAKAQKKLAGLQDQLEAERIKREGTEAQLSELQEGMGKLVATGKRTAKDVTGELNELRTGIELAQAVERTLAISIGEAEAAVKDAMIVDYREQAGAKEKELVKHEAEVAKLLAPVLANEDLAGLQVAGGKAETAKARGLRAAIQNLKDNAKRLELGLTLQPNIYEGLPERAPGCYPVPDLAVNIPE